MWAAKHLRTGGEANILKTLRPRPGRLALADDFKKRYIGRALKYCLNCNRKPRTFSVTGTSSFPQVALGQYSAAAKVARRCKRANEPHQTSSHLQHLAEATSRSPARARGSVVSGVSCVLWGWWHGCASRRWLIVALACWLVLWKNDLCAAGWCCRADCSCVDCASMVLQSMGWLLCPV